MNILKRIASVLSILVLLTSVVGVSVSRHYCLGMLRHEHFFTPSERCAAEKVMDCHHEYDGNNSIAPDCCEDEYIAIPGLEVESQVKENGLISIVSAHLVHAYFSDHNTPPYSTPQYWEQAPNPPPLLGKQILVLHQRFTI